MKKLYNFLNFFLFLGLMALFCSCSQEEMAGSSELETGGWHSAKVRLNIDCTGYETNGEGTRTAADAWQDGDVVYLLLSDKDGNNVQAYVRYDATEQEWGEVMYEGYKSYLTCTVERKAEAYFIEGVNNLQTQNITFSNDKAVYVCSSGSYSYPEDGDMTVTVSLKPLTGRIRFKGTAGTTATIEGLKTCTSFSRTTGSVTTSTAKVSTTVAADGSTPYIYCLFADTSSPTLTITSDNTYRTVFDSSTSVLKAGKSGFLTLPTNEDHRGWMTLQGVTGITLDKTSVSLKPGSTAQLTATVSPDNANDKSVKWSSSNTAVATVDNTGKVTAVKRGTATITVQSVSNSNVKATCTVTVIEETRTFTVGGVTFKMKLVEAGTFQMGSTTGDSDEKPVHSVTISKDYYMGETEVTQALWKAVTGYSPTSSGSAWSSTYGLGDNYPAYYISYADVQSFITKLNSLTGEKFRMPTEAEWEYAARGGKKSKGYTYSGSNTAGDVAWYTSNSSKTHIVKTKAANELGIYDMSGNVYEWCSDWYSSSYYTSSAQTDPTGPATGSNRVGRGGNWYNSATYCRCADRVNFTPSSRGNLVGFRLAL